MLEKVKKLKSVTVDTKLRKAASNSWLDNAAIQARAAAIKKRRKENTSLGPKLSPQELVQVADELEEIQRQLNLLEKKHDELGKGR